MSEIKNTLMKICDELNIYREEKKRIKWKGVIKDIPTWMYASMRDYFRNQEV